MGGLDITIQGVGIEMTPWIDIWWLSFDHLRISL